MYYRVQTRASHHRLYDSAKVYSVEGRFNDFKALHKHLTGNAAYAGYGIPKLPAEAGSWSGWLLGESEEFVRERKTALEVYLCSLVAKETLRQDSELFTFLTDCKHESLTPRVPQRIMTRLADTGASWMQNMQRVPSDKDSLVALYRSQTQG